MSKQEVREQILNRYVAGEISMDEAEALLDSVGNAEPEEVIPPATEEESKPELPEGFQRFRFYWIIPLLVGVVFTLWGGFGIFNQYTKNSLSFGFWLAWLPLFLGVVIITLAVSSSKGHWLHVRVNTGQDEWPRKIALSFPLPVALLKLGLNAKWNFNIDGLADSQGKILVSDLLNALDESDQPLIVHVDEHGGEKVQVMIW